ncbi:MAG: hypothetical protein DHS20C01_10940 [marine bacterium B5-7]|nr:MAG: hypothetical protein DHS20C01_10940 [marine bacterium B5-7]
MIRSERMTVAGQQGYLESYRVSEIGLLLVGVLALVYWIAVVWPMLDPANRDFHDFRLYYLAAKAYWNGGDPYEVALRVGNFRIYYIYPAITLWVFLPFTWFSYPVACVVYLLLKCLAGVGLVFLWSRVFLGRPGPWFLLFCLFAFNSAWYIDLETGNVELFLQLALWSGLACFISGRYHAFTALVCLAALFKITPILFIALLFLSPGPKRAIRIILPFIGGLAILFLISLIIDPDWLPHMLQESGRNTKLVAPLNQSVLNLLNDVSRNYFSAGKFWPLVFFAVFVIVVIEVSVRAFRRTFGPDDDRNLMERRKLGALFAALLYILILPRLQDYQFLFAIVPCFFLIQRNTLAAVPLLFVLFVIPATRPRLPGLTDVYQMLFHYKEWVIVMLTWIWFARNMAVRNRT